ncbi:MAG: HNH endonuclease [Desulfotomaculum sp.]|nr:HNH endonuclease [Desulfotomaculum sp.]
MDIFKCSNSGGMRRSHRTNSLVIVSDHTKSIYEDRWVDGIFHYTGMGLEGDQSLDYAQNKTLAQSHTNGVNVYLFEVFEPQKYVFIGQVELAGEPYQEQQPDANGNLRTVWVFPLKLVDAASALLPQEILTKKQERKNREASRLTDQELEIRARFSKKGVGVRQVSTTTYERNSYVSEFAKRRANGICQLCENPAPFNDKYGNPYLETHHIVWLSEGGDDSIENTVALCPNCHRKMHALNLKSDREKLKRKALSGIAN